MEARKVPNGKRESAYIVFGAGMFGKNSIKLKGNKCGVTGVSWRAVKRREAAGDLIAVTIDEYNTSKVCNACNNDPLAKMSELKGCSVLICNACKNMLSISLSIWDGRGRPSKYRRN